jgi:hypothetical protein
MQWDSTVVAATWLHTAQKFEQNVKGARCERASHVRRIKKSMPTRHCALNSAQPQENVKNMGIARNSVRSAGGDDLEVTETATLARSLTHISIKDSQDCTFIK